MGWWSLVDVCADDAQLGGTRQIVTGRVVAGNGIPDLYCFLSGDEDAVPRNLPARECPAAHRDADRREECAGGILLDVALVEGVLCFHFLCGVIDYRAYSACSMRHTTRLEVCNSGCIFLSMRYAPRWVMRNGRTTEYVRST